MQLQDRRGRKGKTSGVREGDVSKGSKMRQREKPRIQGRRERDGGGQQCRLCGLECRLSLSVPGCPFNMFDGTLCPAITFPFLVKEKAIFSPSSTLQPLLSLTRFQLYFLRSWKHTSITYCDQAHFFKRILWLYDKEIRNRLRKFLTHSLKVSLAPKEERCLNYTAAINQQYLPGTWQVLFVALFIWGLFLLPVQLDSTQWGRQPQ